MALNFDYENSTKKELQAEVDARNASGRKVEAASANKADLVAALIADDKASVAAGAPVPTIVKPNVENFGDYEPNVMGWNPEDRAKYGNVQFKKRVTPHPDPEKAVKGHKQPLAGDGGIYFLRVDADEPRGNTHILKNKTHEWRGSEDQFKAAFEELPED